MGHHQHIEVTSTKPYEFTRKNRMIAGVMIIIGLIAIIAQFATHHTQTWSNLLMNNFMFMGMALCATFFLAVQYVAEVGWSAVIKRPVEAMGQALPVAGGIMIVIILLGGQSLYHWMAPGISTPGSENYDAIIAGKNGFLNPAFFWIRVVAYFAIWTYFTKLFRKNSLLSDEGDGKGYWQKNRSAAAKFLVLFAATESTMSWDFIMSIDTHWYSTLFAWYTFAGMFVTSIAALVFTITYLKSKGYLQEVTEHHLHDIGKFMFAFSIFWTYLWFCQFMLIWYSNIPEEVTYFMLRQDHYRGWWLGSFFINFIAPFVILMTRDAKRKLYLLMYMSIVIFIGHWIDTFVMVIPGSMLTAGHHAAEAGAHHGHSLTLGSVGLMEIGTTLGFIGLFMYLVQHHLSKAPLVAKNHPMLEESLHHAI
ncbi:MAG: hypothetical protein RLZZ94_814 [Bacteroidota bacterium]